MQNRVEIFFINLELQGLSCCYRSHWGVEQLLHKMPHVLRHKSFHVSPKKNYRAEIEGSI